MFWHLFKYRLKVLLKEKQLLFWSGIFPIILGTFFYMAFSDITEKTENISEINVSISVKEGNGSPEEVVKGDEAYAGAEIW